jgi:hypothetical protein
MAYDQLSIIQAFFFQTWCVTHVYSYVTCMYSYVTRMYLYVTHIYWCGVLVMIEVSLQMFIELPLIIIIIINF